MESIVETQTITTATNINNTKMFYTVILICLSLLIYLTSISLVSYDNNIWYLKKVENFNVPDFYFSGFGKVIAGFSNLCLGLTLFYIAKQLDIESKVGREKGCFSKFIFIILPLLLLTYALVYPLMCGLNSIYIGAIIMTIATAMCVVFNIYVFISFSYTPFLSCLVFTLFLLLETIILFVNTY